MDGLSFFYLNLFRVYGNLEALKIGKGFVELGLEQFGNYEDFYSKAISFNKISLFNFPISTFYIAEYYLESGIELLGLNNVLQNKLVDWIERYYSDDFDFDLLSGGSGTIIYLLKLYDRIKEDRLLLLCKKIALNIIRNAIITNDDSLSWITKFGKTHTGFSHGTSGIAFSLFKLNAYLPDEEIKLAAIKALNFERKMYDVEKNYWYSFKLYENDNIETIKNENHFWAYGSGGIALSRILILDYYQDEIIKNEIDISVNNLKEKGWSGNFNYSSGVFGNIDVLNEYAHKLQDNDVKCKLNDFLNTIINEKRNGFESWSCAAVGKKSNSNFEMIGFFTGISGINNTMLNIINYDKTVKLFK
nr:lanthionine synthetase LanC family protein [uncultured Flavobacterium sp.]